MSWKLTSDTIRFIVDNFAEGSKILELGSGDGTEILVDYGFSVSSIEQNPDWAFKYHDDYILAPVKFNETSKRWWFDPTYLEGKLPTEYDLLIIDGPTGRTSEYEDCRLGILDHLELFNMDASILIDDIGRPKELELFNILSEGRQASIRGRFGFIWGTILQEITKGRRAAYTELLNWIENRLHRFGIEK